ncbi:MAG TPA: XrtA system polysaccharide deacetylase [Methylomirabilota bacterium]|jgi:polysaccharide deacetylase family protein (PEP-CTERM system associated)|nr:XrtA system polysaccharide deacetylase [Methylomirabilota bacterium]
MRNAFSVDVEDWYQVSDFEEAVGFEAWDRYESRVVRNTERVLALLDEYGVKGTFFVLTWNAERHPELVRRIAEAGHEIATHGYRHRLIYEQTPAEFRDDVLRSKKILEDAVGLPVLGYRAPSFSLTQASLWALDILLESGFRYDSSIFPVSDRLYGIPDARRFPFVIRADGGRTLVEFPMSTARAAGRNWPLGGGAYLRLFPYPYMRWGIRRVNREGQPALVYVHPWELDPGQPRLKVGGKRGLSTHYINLHRTEAKLRRLLHDFSFAPARDVLGLY